MFEEQVARRIRALAPNNLFQSRLRTFGLPESVVGEKLAGVEEAYPGHDHRLPRALPRDRGEGARARGVARRRPATSATAPRSRSARASARTSTARPTTPSPASSGAPCARAAGRSPSPSRARAASSGHMLTREPGASEFLLLDAVTYANSAKSRILGVDEEVIRWHGAVSPEVACAMAEGARRVSGADVALSLTGVAGPSGGSDDEAGRHGVHRASRGPTAPDVAAPRLHGRPRADPDAGVVRRAPDGARSLRLADAFGDASRPAGRAQVSGRWARRPWRGQVGADTIRAFVALDLDATSVRRVVRVADRLRMASGAPSATWTPQDQRAPDAEVHGRPGRGRCGPAGQGARRRSSTPKKAPQPGACALEAFPSVEQANDRRRRARRIRAVTWRSWPRRSRSSPRAMASRPRSAPSGRT